MQAWRGSYVPCMIASSVASNFGWQREATKCLENCIPRSFQEVMDYGARILYQAMEPFLRVLGNNMHLMEPLTLQQSSRASMFLGCSSGSTVSSTDLFFVGIIGCCLFSVGRRPSCRGEVLRESYCYCLREGESEQWSFFSAPILSPCWWIRV